MYYYLIRKELFISFLLLNKRHSKFLTTTYINTKFDVDVNDNSVAGAPYL